MGSLIEELRRREAAALAEADRLRSRIEELSGDLARAEEQASRLGRSAPEWTGLTSRPVCSERAGYFPSFPDRVLNPC